MPVNRDPDRSGQAGALTVLTPIAPGAEPDLRAYLEGLRAGPSPLARLPRTHFGRWVIVEDLVSDGEANPDQLATPHLLFTACFDGTLDSYLDELCAELTAEAPAIWGRCLGAPQPTTGAALKAYLRAHHHKTGFFVAAYPEATVGQVRAALAQREHVIAFVRGAQGMDPAQLRSFAQRNEQCSRARGRMNQECFNGGDAGHRQAEEAAKDAAENCWELYRRATRGR